MKQDEKNVGHSIFQRLLTAAPIRLYRVFGDIIRRDGGEWLVRKIRKHRASGCGLRLLAL
ncbi:MAG TPA: hypothetical protein PK329_08470 [Myxococcota bacterium]|nr:MAG: hypothetical protein BWX66_00702 [Deltaproteobacteria bacterium ADurb.Bin058]HOE82980.1 hypothetical protein [Myxococcota bacterium]